MKRHLILSTGLCTENHRSEKVWASCGSWGVASIIIVLSIIFRRKLEPPSVGVGSSSITTSLGFSYRDWSNLLEIEERCHLRMIKAVMDKFLQDRIMKEMEIQTSSEDRDCMATEHKAAWKAELSLSKCSYDLCIHGSLSLFTIFSLSDWLVSGNLHFIGIEMLLIRALQNVPYLSILVEANSWYTALHCTVCFRLD